MNRLPLLLFQLFFLVAPGFLSADTPDAVAKLAAAERELLRADTLYWLARSTGNDIRVHQAALDALTKAQEIAESLGEAGLPIRLAAEAGIEEAEERINAAEELYRNKFPLAWALRGSHIVFERFDNTDERAAINAWAPIEEWVMRPDPGFQILPLIVRAESRVPGVGVEGEVIETIMAAGDATKRLITVPPAVLSRMVGPLEQIGPIGSMPNAHALAAVAPRLLVVDAVITDTMDKPWPVSRITISAWLVDTEKGTVFPAAITDGIAVDARPRYLLPFLLFAFFLFLAGGLGIGLPITSSRFASVAVNSGILLLGYSVGFAGLSLLDPFLPDFGGMALNPFDGVHPPMYRWSLALGGVLALAAGPIPVLAGLQIRNRVLPQLEGLHLARIGPVLAMGMAAGLSLHGVVVDDQGFSYSWVLGIVALGGGLAMLPAFTAFLDVRRPQGQRQWICLLLSTTAVLVAVAGISRGFWLAGGLFMVGVTPFLAWLGYLPVPVETVDSEEVLEDLSLPAGTPAHPAYANFVNPSPADLAASLAENSFAAETCVIHGPKGAGKTRYAREVLNQYRKAIAREPNPRPLLVGVCEPQADQGNGGAQPAYAGLRALLQGVLPVEVIFSNREQLSRVQDQVSAASRTLLEQIPGVGLLMNLCGGSEEQRVTTDRMHRDIALLLSRLLAEKDILFFVDDWQDLDAETVSFLSELPQRIDPARGGLRILITRNDDPSNPPSPPSGTADVWPCRRVEVPALSEESLKAFLHAAGFRTPKREPLRWLLDLGKHPGELLPILTALAHHDQTEETPDGLALPPMETLENFSELIPEDLIARQQQRLAGLRSEAVLLLELAAQCGRHFTGTQLAAGYGNASERMTILKQLRDLEDQYGLVEDLEEEDLFRFESESLRQALLRLSSRRLQDSSVQAGRIREFMREFHFQAAQWLSEHPDTALPPEILSTHCQKAGTKLYPLAWQSSYDAAARAADLGLWEKVLQWIDLNDQLPFRPEPARQDQLDLLRARAYRALGGQDCREKSRVLFLKLEENGNLDGAAMLMDAYEVWMEKGDGSELQSLQEHARERNQIEKDSRKQHVAEFYVVISTQRLRGYQDAEARKQALDALKYLNERLEVKDSDRSMGLLKCRVCQEIASNLGYFAKTDPSLKEKAIQAFEDTSAVKQFWKDEYGLAIAWGTYSAFMESIGKLDEAKDALEKDIQQVEKLGIRADMPRLQNRLAGILWALAEDKPETAEKLRAQAWELSWESFSESVKLSLQFDIAYALINCIKFALDLNDSVKINKVIDYLYVNPLIKEKQKTAEIIISNIKTMYKRGWASEIHTISKIFEMEQG